VILPPLVFPGYLLLCNKLRRFSFVDTTTLVSHLHARTLLKKVLGIYIRLGDTTFSITTVSITTFGKKTFSIMKLSIKCIFVTLSMIDIRHKRHSA
jgi:hypothetical protein